MAVGAKCRPNRKGGKTTLAERNFLSLRNRPEVLAALRVNTELGIAERNSQPGVLGSRHVLSAAITDTADGQQDESAASGWALMVGSIEQFCARPASPPGAFRRHINQFNALSAIAILQERVGPMFSHRGEHFGRSSCNLSDACLCAGQICLISYFEAQGAAEMSRPRRIDLSDRDRAASDRMAAKEGTVSP
jgi:hypothetical protein